MERCQSRRGGGRKLKYLKAGCKVKEKKEERKVEECEVKRRKRRVSQTRQVSLRSSLHSIRGRSCSSGAGCLNFGNKLNKT